MIGSRLYLQICAVLCMSLLLFAGAVTLLWNYLGDDQFNRALFDRTTALAVLLLPSEGSSRAGQQQAVSRIAEALKFKITLYSRNKLMIAASDAPSELPQVDVEKGRWVSTNGLAQWTSQLPDGRWVVIDLDRLPMPSDRVAVALFLGVLAILMALAMYPFVRSLTLRLENLQSQVQRIGSGDLTARVDERGRDEVAALAASFNEAAEQIEALVTAQRLLLANTSHELRTPLARIRLGIEMLQSSDDPSRRAALADDIKELDGLIDELLLMSRLDASAEVADWRTIDFLALVAEECARFPGCAFDGDMAHVRGDPRMLQRLVRNLIDNAYKHGEPPIDVQLRATGKAIELQIADHGQGIPIAERERVFDPFYRAPGKQSVPGYGLGLALVEKIAAAHNATVHIADPPLAQVSVKFRQASSMQASATH